MSEPPAALMKTIEGARICAAATDGWQRWGPYPSDRQWGTVREDYSPGGTAWEYFPHDHARSRAYRWGEDAIAGFSDDQCFWNLGLAVWNGNDPILKERLFGLTNLEGNHGEDVKELYFHLDATPTHSYMRMLYKYPHAAFPYAQLCEQNARRGQDDGEYELLDTGVFDNNRSFDIMVEYAKAGPDDILMRITAHNRADQPADLHILPQLTARNIWSWAASAPKPAITRCGAGVHLAHPHMPPMQMDTDAPCEWMFCENETNIVRLFNGHGEGPFKDGINDAVANGQAGAVSRLQGTKCAAHTHTSVAGRGKATIRLRLRLDTAKGAPFDDFDSTISARRSEADDFYAALQAGIENADARLVQRQALAGLIWSKQFYYFDVRHWLEGDPTQPEPPPSRWDGRNIDWQHLNNAHIVSMPDKWEYPWYASWDLAFQAVTFALIDPQFAKSQLLLLLRDRYMHPNGQLPAYEWSFGDANPPLHAWATWRVYEMDRALNGTPDRAFLREVFNKLLLSFGWWVNRKDAHGRNIFQGGFLGLDNIGIFDRSADLPTGGMIDQADGTGWMGSFALNMMRIALEIAMDDPVYQDIAVKFFEHFLYIARALSMAGNGEGLWDNQDSFFYDKLCLPDGTTVPLRVRSVVGLIPLTAVQVIEPELIANLPDFMAGIEWFTDHRPDLAQWISHVDEPGHGDRRLLSLLRTHRLTRLLQRMLDESEFLSPYGLRAVSKIHESAPYIYNFHNMPYGVTYVPGESNTRQFGGNSNWRGPIWLPINYRLVEALFEFSRYFGSNFNVEYPVGSGQTITLADAATMLSNRLTALSLKGPDGRRPVMAAYPQLDGQEELEELVLFHEYYHGDNGRGVGASHQTGWSATVALLLQPRTEHRSASVPSAAQ